MALYADPSDSESPGAIDVLPSKKPSMSAAFDEPPASSHVSPTPLPTIESASGPSTGLRFWSDRLFHPAKLSDVPPPVIS